MNELDLDRNDWPVCPHCGFVDDGAWEYDLGGIEGSGEVDCPSCGKEYHLQREIDIYYTTSKVEAQP